MTVTFTDIANMALGHVGGGRIENIDDDRSADAQLVRTYFDTARRAELEVYDWSFARKFQALPGAAQAPVGQWLFAYVMPVDCLAARSVQKNTTGDKRVPYEVTASNDGERSLLMTNMPEAILRYTFDQRFPSLYTVNFVMAFSHRLAAYIGYAKTKRRTVQETQIALAAQSRALSQGSDGNAATVDIPPPLADWTLDRDRG